MFQTLSGVQLDGEEVIIVLLEFALGSELVIEDLPHLFEVSE